MARANLYFEPSLRILEDADFRPSWTYPTRNGKRGDRVEAEVICIDLHGLFHNLTEANEHPRYREFAAYDVRPSLGTLFGVSNAPEVTLLRTAQGGRLTQLRMQVIAQQEAVTSQMP